MNSKPRSQNEILVPFSGVSKISDENSRHFHTGVLPGEFPARYKGVLREIKGIAAKFSF